MKKAPSRKGRHARAVSSGHGAIDARPQPSTPAGNSGQTRRKSLAALILAIPPGDASDELDFARVQ